MSLTCVASLMSQTIAKSIEQYAHQLEAMFIDEMFPRKPEEALNQDVARPSAWLTKAKMVVQGDKKLEPFEFQPTVRRSQYYRCQKAILTRPRLVAIELCQAE